MAFAFGPFQMIARLAVRPTTQRFLALVESDQGIRTVVVETLNPDLSANPDARRTFSNEAQIATRLDHRSCVGVDEWGTHDGICWISTPYFPGETWERLLEVSEWRLPTNEVVGLIADLCSGLHYAHTLSDADGTYNIVHRGIAATNILVGDDGQPKILDFGTGKSRIVNDATATGVIKGSFKYMAPEQMLGKATDPRTDVYSLGEVLFEALARQETSTQGLEALAIAKLDEHPRLVDIAPDVHAELDAICARALAVKPEDRYGTAAEFFHALRNYIGKLVRRPSRKSIREMLLKMFGNRIERRAVVLEALANGELDEIDVQQALDGQPAREKHVFEGPDHSYDEAAFLATIRPGSMHAQVPMERQRARPAKARLELRAPRREKSAVEEPPPPTEIREPEETAHLIALLDEDVLMGDMPTALGLDEVSLASLPTAHAPEDDMIDLDLELELPDVPDDLDDEDASTEDEENALALALLQDLPMRDRTTDGGAVDPEPTGIFFKPKRKK